MVSDWSSDVCSSDLKAWGIFGGQDATGPNVTLTTPEHTEDQLFKVNARSIPKGSVVLLETGGGGGYGDPLERDVDHIREDIIDGYITIEGAKRDYKVVFNADLDRKSVV